MLKRISNVFFSKINRRKKLENSDEGHFQAVTLPLRGVYVYKFQESTEPRISREFQRNWRKPRKHEYKVEFGHKIIHLKQIKKSFIQTVHFRWVKFMNHNRARSE